MKFKILSAILSILMLSHYSCTTNNKEAFNNIYALLSQDNYFEAQESFLAGSSKLSKPYRNYTEAVLHNAFNKSSESERLINSLLNNDDIPDSLLLTLYEIKYDNAIKLYDYAEAKNAVEAILGNFSSFLSEDEAADYSNSLRLWDALQNTPPMTVDISDNTAIEMKKDIAGLNNLKISTGIDSLFFIFDTGANLSTTTRSVARQLDMNIIPTDIEVGSITGVKVMAQLAVCDSLSMGQITWTNVVFLVMPDEALAFPQIDYQIYGVLGFPVIESLNEIRITGDGLFIVPEEESVFTGTANMAMNGLTPLIYLDNKHFTFDTGADNTMLYHAYYEENKEVIEGTWEPETISFGGAGGHTGFEGYKIDYPLTVSGKEVVLKDIHCLKEKIRDSETVYGNIGQDLIQQFDTLTINFNKMFIDFR